MASATDHPSSNEAATSGRARSSTGDRGPVAGDRRPVAGDGKPGATPEVDPRRRFVWFQAVPAWVISTLVHVMILLILGLISLADPAQMVAVLSASRGSDDGPEMDEFAIEAIDPADLSESEAWSEPVEVTELTDPVEAMSLEVPMEVATVPMDITDLASQMAPAAATLQTLASLQSSSMSSRSSDMKRKLLRDYGGNAASEAAVTEALKWLARHQLPNGAWTFHHSLVCNARCGDPGEVKYGKSFNAATAMALLPFLGAGQTHYDGEFKEVVRRGLLFLIGNGRAGRQGGLPMLDLTDNAGNMYSHGLAAITLCEAYAMTEDPALAGPAQASLNFIVYAQCRDGGWRYQPRQASGGDTSVVGWQVMALKSGHMGHLVVPPITIQGAVMFLDRVSSDGGAIYGYTEPSTSVRPACTAIGLLCRMYTGWDKTHPGIVAGVKHLSKIGVLKDDIYYNYYAAQVLRHYGGSEWDRFNQELRDWLVESQVQNGHAKGSWHFPDSRTHRGPKEGGRLASTAIATMILEVYYRHMPLYADSAAEDDFPL